VESGFYLADIPGQAIIRSMSEPNSIGLPPDSMIVAITTTSSRESAEAIAKHCIERGLAACVQIDAETTSFYKWDGEIQNDSETRIWLKAVSTLEEPLKNAVFNEHPYDTPQWIVFKPENIDEKYLKWAKEVSNFHGFL